MADAVAVTELNDGIRNAVCSIVLIPVMVQVRQR
jgi:hypothetical protein